MGAGRGGLKLLEKVTVCENAKIGLLPEPEYVRRERGTSGFPATITLHNCCAAPACSAEAGAGGPGSSSMPANK